MTTETAILAGGCFWGAQELLRKRPGVLASRVGYSGGDTPNATYRNHGDHAEAVEIVFDPEVILFRELLEFFFRIHDPSTKDRQGEVEPAGPFWEAEEDQDYLQKIPFRYTCHYVRPDWVLPRREAQTTR